MGDKEGNAGFVGLHNPTGEMLVVFFLLFTFALIVAGGMFFRIAQQRDQEVRKRLKESGLPKE
jgi:hypothetical protein